VRERKRERERETFVDEGGKIFFDFIVAIPQWLSLPSHGMLAEGKGKILIASLALPVKLLSTKENVFTLKQKLAVFRRRSFVLSVFLQTSCDDNKLKITERN
jgi:hypothetical protein